MHTHIHKFIHTFSHTCVHTCAFVHTCVHSMHCFDISCCCWAGSCPERPCGCIPLAEGAVNTPAEPSAPLTTKRCANSSPNLQEAKKGPPNAQMHPPFSSHGAMIAASEGSCLSSEHLRHQCAQTAPPRRHHAQIACAEDLGQADSSRSR